MRVPGRFWWGEALAACVVAAIAIVVPILYLSNAIPLDIEIGISPVSDVALAISCALVCLTLNLVLATMSARGLANYRRRRCALRGDQEAMPLAASLIATVGNSHHSDAPLVLHWRRKRSILLLRSLQIGVVGLTILLNYAIGSYFGLRELAQHADTPDYLGAHAVLVGLLIATFIALGILYVALARIMWFQWRHSFGVTATADGLECVHETGRRTFIPWSDARLFEVEKRGRGVVGDRIWRLYGGHDVAVWNYRPMSEDVISDGASTVEMKLRMDVLAQFINARTELPPRTLSPSLAATSAPAPQRLWWVVIVYALLAAFSLALAVTVVVAPLTDTLWLDITLSLPLVNAAIQLVRILRRFDRSVSQQTSRADVRDDPAIIIALNDDSLHGTAYALLIGPSRTKRLGAFFTGALLAVEILPCIQMGLATTSTDAAHALHFTLLTPPPPQTPLLSLAGALAWILAAYGGMGLMLCFFAIYAHGATIRADDVGLSMVGGSITVTYPWSDMGEIREHVVGDDVVGYAVHNRAGATILSWPSRPAEVVKGASWSGALPISPEALAQLVSQRISGAEATESAPRAT